MGLYPWLPSKTNIPHETKTCQNRLNLKKIEKEGRGKKLYDEPETCGRTVWYECCGICNGIQQPEPNGRVFRGRKIEPQPRYSPRFHKSEVLLDWIRRAWSLTPCRLRDELQNPTRPQIWSPIVMTEEQRPKQNLQRKRTPGNISNVHGQGWTMHGACDARRCVVLQPDEVRA
jgi:hypothetical protein